MHTPLDTIQDTLTAWPAVTAKAHRFGGVEFNIDSTEIGHVHSTGMVDIPFTVKLRTQLLAEGKAKAHHLLPETGWISFYIRSDADVEQALWLLRLSYLFYASRGSHRTALAGRLDVKSALDALHLSDAMRAVFNHATRLA